MQIRTTIATVGDKSRLERVTIEYRVEDAVIGTQTIGLAGVNPMLPGTTNGEGAARHVGQGLHPGQFRR
ncbi:MAG: hypothetical protein HLUCCA08_08990 [Rhodobacteraceae bacterium HLUCCA08]|nr:MAG: hypothetical protein HLUCCA08_08990 [Rhodobacteraceae bacterium HLUCCA08]